MHFNTLFALLIVSCLSVAFAQGKTARGQLEAVKPICGHAAKIKSRSMRLFTVSCVGRHSLSLSTDALNGTQNAAFTDVWLNCAHVLFPQWPLKTAASNMWEDRHAEFRNMRWTTDCRCWMEAATSRLWCKYMYIHRQNRNFAPFLLLQVRFNSVYIEMLSLNVLIF